MPKRKRPSDDDSDIEREERERLIEEAELKEETAAEHHGPDYVENEFDAARRHAFMTSFGTLHVAMLTSTYEDMLTM